MYWFLGMHSKTYMKHHFALYSPVTISNREKTQEKTQLHFYLRLN